MIIAVTGKYGAGKSTALQILGCLGARILSIDHYKHIVGDKVDIVTPIKEMMKEFRQLSPVTMAIEVPLDLAKTLQNEFDHIIIVEADSFVRLVRLWVRDSKTFPDQDDFIPVKTKYTVVKNNGLYSKFVSKILSIWQNTFFPYNQ